MKEELTSNVCWSCRFIVENLGKENDLPAHFCYYGRKETHYPSKCHHIPPKWKAIDYIGQPCMYYDGLKVRRAE